MRRLDLIEKVSGGLELSVGEVEGRRAREIGRRPRRRWRGPARRRQSPLGFVPWPCAPRPTRSSVGPTHDSRNRRRERRGAPGARRWLRDRVFGARSRSCLRGSAVGWAFRPTPRPGAAPPYATARCLADGAHGSDAHRPTTEPGRELARREPRRGAPRPATE